MLNDVLATELVCVLRYKRHYYTADRAYTPTRVRQEFLQHAGEEQQHADWIAERITPARRRAELQPRGHRRPRAFAVRRRARR